MRMGALALLLVCGSASAQSARLEGVTVESTTGRPLAGVHVRVITIDTSYATKVYGAMSDREGRFVIAAIPPGSYFYMGELAGYLSPARQSGGSPLPMLTVRRGESAASLKVEMIPRATVGGRVLDDYGDPVQNAQVHLTPAATASAIPVNEMAMTDDRGEYRITARPGRYHVRATWSPGMFRPEIRSDGTSQAEYAPTYHPDSPAPNRAAAVEVAAGAEIHDIDIRLSRTMHSGQGAGSVSGVVSGIPDSRGWATVHLVAHDPQSRSTFSQTSQTSDGKFSFANPRPGSYKLFARYTLDGKNLMSQTVEFTDASPLSGVTLRLAPGVELGGAIEVAGGELPQGKRTVTLRPLDGAMMAPAISGEVEADRTFRIAGVFPGRYRLSVQPLPERAYIRAVEVDGAASASPDEIDFARVPGRLKVTIGANAAQIAGKVDENAPGVVFLLRDPKKVEGIGEEFTALLKADGSYSFPRVRPGKYWLLAVESFRTGELLNPEVLDKTAALAEVIEVKEGDRIRKDLRFVTREALDAKPKQ